MSLFYIFLISTPERNQWLGLKKLPILLKVKGKKVNCFPHKVGINNAKLKDTTHTYPFKYAWQHGFSFSLFKLSQKPEQVLVMITRKTLFWIRLQEFLSWILLSCRIWSVCDRISLSGRDLIKCGKWVRIPLTAKLKIKRSNYSGWSNNEAAFGIKKKSRFASRLRMNWSMILNCLIYC